MVPPADPVYALENSFAGLNLFSPNATERYFDKFSGVKGFQSNSSATIQSEFNRLSKHLGWRGKAAHRERLRCYADEASYFLHATRPGLSVLQNLCLDLNVTSAENVVELSNNKCKKVLYTTFYINK